MHDNYIYSFIIVAIIAIIVCGLIFNWKDALSNTLFAFTGIGVIIIGLYSNKNKKYGSGEEEDLQRAIQKSLETYVEPTSWTSSEDFINHCNNAEFLNYFNYSESDLSRVLAYKKCGIHNIWIHTTSGNKNLCALYAIIQDLIMHGFDDEYLELLIDICKRLNIGGRSSWFGEEDIVKAILPASIGLVVLGKVNKFDMQNNECNDYNFNIGKEKLYTIYTYIPEPCIHIICLINESGVHWQNFFWDNPKAPGIDVRSEQIKIIQVYQQQNLRIFEQIPI